MTSATIIRASPGSAAPTALFQLNRPADAARLFDALRPCRALAADPRQGLLLGRRAPPPPAAMQAQASAWLEQAAASPDQFYGQLALERLGRTPPAPPSLPPADPGERAAFEARPLVQAVRYLGAAGRRGDQTIFVRALAASLENDRDRAMAGELGRMIGRLDLGVWAAREARADGDNFYDRAAFPQVPIPPGLCPQLGFRQRHHPPGKLVRADRDQQCRRARADAAHAGHRAPCGGAGRRALRFRPADRGPAI